MSFVEFFAELNGKIGIAGFALIFIGVAAVYLTVKNAVYLWLTGKSFNKIISSAEINQKSNENMLKNNLSNPLVSVLYELIETHGTHSNDVKAEVAYLFYRKFRKVIRDVTMIRVIAVISPLLGLLGTLLGLLGVFKALSTTTAMETSTVLAAGIWEAILTTIMGLMLAIPSLVAYYALNLTMRSFNLSTVEYGYRFLGYRPGCRHIKKEASL